MESKEEFALAQLVLTSATVRGNDCYPSHFNQTRNPGAPYLRAMAAQNDERLNEGDQGVQNLNCKISEAMYRQLQVKSSHSIAPHD